MAPAQVPAAAKPVEFDRNALVYQSDWRGVAPFASRKWNDVPFGILFVVLFCCVLITGFVAGHISREKYQHEQQQHTPHAATFGDVPSVEVRSSSLSDVDMIEIAISALGAAIFLSFAWLLLLRHFTKAVVIGSLILFGIYLIAFGAYIIYLIAQGHTELIFAAVIFCLFGLFFFLLIFLWRKRIPVAVAFLKESTFGALQHPAMVFLVGPTILIVGAGLAIAVIASSYWTVAEPVWSPALNWTVGLVALFTVYWVFELKQAFLSHAYAGVYAQWYYSRSGGARTYSVWSHVGYGLTKQFGTLAAGSMLVAVIRFVRALLRYAERNRGGGIAGLVILIVVCFLRCVCWILQALVEYVTRYVYVYTAIYGDSFCTGAKSVFSLFARSDCQPFLNDLIAGPVVEIGVLLVGAFSGGVSAFVCWSLLSARHAEIALTPMLTAALIGFIIGCFVAAIPGRCIIVGVDSLFVCFFEDLERNVGRPHYFSRQWVASCQDAHNCPAKLKAVDLPPQQPFEQYISVNNGYEPLRESSHAPLL